MENLTTETKLQLKKNIDVWEIIAKYPSGQAGQKEDEFIVANGNSKIRLSETDINSLFELYKPSTKATTIINQVEQFKKDQLEQFREQSTIDLTDKPEPNQETQPEPTEPSADPTKPLNEPIPDAEKETKPSDEEPTDEGTEKKSKKKGPKNAE